MTEPNPTAPPRPDPESTAARFRVVAADFSARCEAVPADRWSSPAPCEGWVARDVVDHLVSWLPAFFLDSWDVPRPDVPSIDEDPVGAWAAVRDAMQEALDDPAVATRERDTPLGRHFADAVAMGAVPDVLVHTWDLSRATGLDEHLDADEVARLAADLEQMPFEAMEASGQYGPRVPVPEGADDQTRLLAAMGRTP